MKRFNALTLSILMPAAAILCGGLTACVYDREEPEFSIPVGAPLPEFSVELLNGERFSTASLPESDICNLIILFFNTTCSDCKRELPRVQQLYDRILADENLRPATRLICIAREEDAASIRTYWEDHNLTLPAAPQPDRTVYNLFASVGIPRLYVAQPLPDTRTFAITACLNSTSDLLQILQ